MIQDTSLEAYKVLTPELGDRQKQVYDMLKVYPGSSNHDISRILGIPINCITPRVLEFRSKGLVICSGSKKDETTKRRVNKWKVIKEE